MKLKNINAFGFFLLICLCIQISSCGNDPSSSTPSTKAFPVEPSTPSLQKNKTSLPTSPEKASLTQKLLENSKTSPDRNEVEGSLFGIWKCKTKFNNENCTFLWQVRENNTYKLYIGCPSGESITNGEWSYSKNVVTTIANGERGTYPIIWTNADEFTLRDNGLNRNYSRSNETIPIIKAPNKPKLKECSMPCLACNSTGMVPCNSIHTTPEDLRCVTPQRYADCMTNPNPGLVSYTCCRCFGTGIYKYKCY